MEQELRENGIKYKYSMNNSIIICMKEWYDEETLYKLCNIILCSTMPFMIVTIYGCMLYRFGNRKHELSTQAKNIANLDFSSIERSSIETYKLMSNV